MEMVEKKGTSRRRLVNTNLGLVRTHLNDLKDGGKLARLSDHTCQFRRQVVVLVDAKSRHFWLARVVI
jgi:hypothetical protein